MVLGIVAIVLSWIPILGVLLGVLGLVLGLVAMKNPLGKGMSMAGIICGSLATLGGLIWTIYVIANEGRL